MPTGRAMVNRRRGRFRSNQAFTVSAWVKLTTPASTGAHRRPHGRPAGLPRLGPVDRRTAQSGTHIVNTLARQRPQGRRRERASSRASGITVCMTYDGSGKAAGVKMYVNGAPQATVGRGRHAQGHASERSPAEDRSAQQRVAVGSRADPGFAALRPRCSRPGGRPDGREHAGCLALPKPAGKRTPAEKDELFAWWLSANDKPIAGS